MLSTASYDARKHGVRSGMPGFIAKKLFPELIILDHHFPRYMEMSRQVMEIFRRYDPDMQVAGCDEGYLKWAFTILLLRLLSSSFPASPNIVKPTTLMWRAA